MLINVMLIKKTCIPLKLPQVYMHSKEIKCWHFTQSQNIINLHGLRCLYYSFIHSYLNYGNGWTSTNRTKQKKLAAKQREAIRIIDDTNEKTLAKFSKNAKFKNIEYSQN